MKKGVVLLITLFFITAISVLVLKNLDDTDKFLQEQNYILNNTQALISIKNIKNEVVKLLKNHKDDVDKALEHDALQNMIPLNFEQLDIKFQIKKYDKIDINEMKSKKSTIVEDFFQDNNIFDYEEFSQIYNKKLEGNGAVETSKQLDDIINTFIIKSENQEISKHKDKLGFIKSNSSYELFIDVNYLDAVARAYYLLSNTNGKVEVQYFDISFK